ncbi:MAG: dipeptide ABC transporter ATP-binding protein [Erysipelotrichaceae bacterium]|nr:dipeptide ABC transporter ATP-binding protein [Erysipelotrichaceae bacterium]MBO7698847.1 dipeptide ABC transporter ATP-binding protein [Erysipelotrichaceae bacterium]MBP5280178.1 dipeptide ABC transporter ATP-binding protein [Erysipelotrichaceae bacterium]
MSDNVILKVSHLKTYFDVTKGLFAPKQIVKAVDDVSFEVKEGETLGIVGESGCGKSTLGRTIVKLYEPVDGTIEYRGKDISKLKGNELKAFRKEVQMIFQDPYASLNPRMTVGEIIMEPMIIHNIYETAAEREARVVELLEIVGLKPDHIRRYPSEFSGGQRQRIGIARALAVNPTFIVCDEPISALDVSIQAQVINLLEQIQKEMNLSYMFIAHDLSMVRHISDRIGVMYLGHMMEIGPANDVFYRPLHPYTIALLSAIPISDPDIAKAKNRIILEGEIPSPINPPAGCPFASRCSKATERCSKQTPEPIQVGDRLVTCFLYEK